MQPFTGIFKGAIYTWLTFSGLLIAADSMRLWSLRVYVYMHTVPKSDCLHLLRENKETGKYISSHCKNQLMCEI